MVCRLTLRFPSKLPPHPPTDRTQSPLSRATHQLSEDTSSLLLGVRQVSTSVITPSTLLGLVGLFLNGGCDYFQLVTHSALPHQTVANAADLNLISWSPTIVLITLHAHRYIPAAVPRGHQTTENSLGSPQAAYAHWYHRIAHRAPHHPPKASCKVKRLASLDHS